MINEEWRKAEEEGRQTKLRAEALEAKRQEEAMRADEAQAQEQMRQHEAMLRQQVNFLWCQQEFPLVNSML